MSQAARGHTDWLSDRLTGRLTILVRQTVSHVLAEETLAHYPSACLSVCLYVWIIFLLWTHYSYLSENLLWLPGSYIVWLHFVKSAHKYTAQQLVWQLTGDALVWHIAQIFVKSPSSPRRTILPLFLCSALSFLSGLFMQLARLWLESDEGTSPPPATKALQGLVATV